MSRNFYFKIRSGSLKTGKHKNGEMCFCDKRFEPVLCGGFEADYLHKILSNISYLCDVSGLFCIRPLLLFFYFPTVSKCDVSVYRLRHKSLAISRIADEFDSSVHVHVFTRVRVVKRIDNVISTLMDMAAFSMSLRIICRLIYNVDTGFKIHYLRKCFVCQKFSYFMSRCCCPV